MPEFQIVIESPALGRHVERTVFANFADDALTDYLDGMEPHGVKRLSGTSARFLDEVTVTARPVVSEKYDPAALAAESHSMFPGECGSKLRGGTWYCSRYCEEQARRVVAEVVPMYASAGAMAAPGRERWRR